MTPDEWDHFVRLTSDAQADGQLAAWLELALGDDLDVLVFVGCRTLFEAGCTLAQARQLAEPPAAEVRAAREDLLREARRGVVEVAALVNAEPDPDCRAATITRLHSPEYIFRDILRELVAERYSRGFLQSKKQAAALLGETWIWEEG